MGVNMPDATGEGTAFSNAMKFPHDEKTFDENKYRTDVKYEAWDKYIDENIVPTGNGSCEGGKCMNSHRPSKSEYYLDIASAVAKRGTCLRRKFGAVIVKNNKVVSTGYVGAPKGRKNCIDIGTCFRMKHNIPSGTRYEKCRSCHAEMNAVIFADKEELEGSTLYLVGIENDGSITPNADCCAMCKRVIINAEISKVVIRTPTGSKTIDVNDWIINDDSLDFNHEGY